MLQSRFFWRLYLTFAILVLIATAGTGFLVHQQLQAVLYRDLELQLLNLAHALSPFAQDIYVKGPSAAPNNRPELGHEWPRHVQERVVEIGRETDTRISLMAPDGEVIADSQSDPATM